MRRFARRAILAILVLLLLVAIVVQAVLWSDLPRQQVEAALEGQFGLEVAVDDLSTGWLGRTTIEGLTLSLPLHDEPLVVAPRATAAHHGVLRLLLTRKLGLSSIELERPEAVVRQRPTGGWNIQDAWQTVQARLGGKGDGGGGPPRLPDLRVTDGRLRLERPGRDAVTLTGLEVRGTADGRLRYAIDLEAPALGEASATVAMGAPFAHEVSARLAPAAELWAQLLPDVPATTARGTWRGEWRRGEAAGTLDLESLTVGPHGARGVARASFDPRGQRLHLEPRSLAVTLHELPAPLQLTGGALDYAWMQSLRLDALELAAFDTGAVISGEVDPAEQTGEVRVAWSGSAEQPDIRHRGEAVVTSARGALGRRTLRATTTATASSPLGEWSARLTSEAAGDGWAALSGRTVAEQLEVTHDERRFHLDGLAAAWSVAGARFTLERASLPPAAQPRTLSMAGFYDVSAKRWELATTAAAFALPAVPFPIDHFEVRSRGTLEVADFERIRLQTGPVQLSGRGAYAFGTDKQPLFLDVHVDKAPIALGDDDEAMRLSVDNLSGRLEVHGRLSPLSVDVGGDLLATALTVTGDRLGDIAAKVQGTIDSQRLRFVATAPTWLGGQWRLDADWDRAVSRGRFDLHADDLDLAVVDELFGLPFDVTGLGGLRVAIHAPAETGRGRFDAAGTVTAVDLAVSASTARFVADRVEGDLLLDDQRLEIRDLHATRGEGGLDATGLLDLAAGSATAQVTLRDWPLLFAGSDAVIALTGDIRGERPAEGEPEATARLDTAWHVGGEPVGTLTLHGAVRPQRLEVERLEGDFLGGRVAGQGVVDIQSYIASDFTLEWEGLEMDRFRPYVGGLDLGGEVSGSLVFESPDDPRALAPLKATMTIDAGHVNVAGLPFGQGTGVAYTDGHRVVLQNLEVAAAGGKLTLWGRINQRPRPAAPGESPAEEWVVYATAAAEGLDVATLSEALDPDTDPIVGKLDVEVTISSPIGDWERAFGRGTIALSESDLGNIPLFGAVYSLVNLQIGSIVPEGRGRSEFRVEEGVVYFPSFRFANRGFQLHFIGLRLLDLWAGAASPIAGHATVGQSLLPDTRFLGSINEAMQNLQADFFAARLQGTFGQPEVVPDTFQGIRDLVGAPIAGD